MRNLTVVCVFETGLLADQVNTKTQERFMAKGTDAKKAAKKQPGKTLKEKRKEKKDKKGQRVYEPTD